MGSLAHAKDTKVGVTQLLEGQGRELSLTGLQLQWLQDPLQGALDT